MSNVLNQSSSVKQIMEELAELVVLRPEFESAFLSMIGDMEEVAAREINKTIGSRTPTNAILEIVAHAQDEHRHAFQLRNLKPLKSYTDVKYYYLEKELSELGVNFVLGFFGQPILLNARKASRFSGYVHGAITVEQLPLQMYTAYYKLTQSESIKKGLAAVLKDEAAHLELGRKFFSTLLEEEKFSIEQINKIELEMCAVLGRKLIQTITRYLKTEHNNQYNAVVENKLEQAARILALSEHENKLNRHSNAAVLNQSVQFLTNKTSTIDQETVANISAILATLTQDEYVKYLQQVFLDSHMIGVCYAVDSVLRDILNINSDISEVAEWI